MRYTYRSRWLMVLLVAALAAIVALPAIAQEDEEEADDAGCALTSQPVALRLATAFGLVSADLVTLHCEGYGYGNIARAFLLEEQTGISALTYLEQHSAGMGWGQIMREAGIHPSQLAPGRVLGNANGNGQAVSETETEAEDEPSGRGIGNANGNANGNSNGNGNGNANGNGRGRGG